MTFRELSKLLEQNGWKPIKKENGSSHIMYQKDNKKVPIPIHSEDIAKGTLNEILKQTGLK